MRGAKVKLTARDASKRTPRIRRISTFTHKKPDGNCRLSTPLLQPALRVGAANDPLEREAETTAERIVSMPAPEPAAPSAEPAAGGQSNAAPGDAGQSAQARRASADDQPDLDTLETAPPIPADHQDPEVPKEEDVDTAGLSAEDMAEIESGEPEDTGGEGGAEAPPPAEEPPAQAARSGDAAVVGAEGGAAPSDVAQRVAQPGSGRPLPAPVRAFMEPRFGKDFSDVRIHDAPQDRTAARRIGARAFTHRQHIWMGPGEAVEDRRLLAHELTHVVQQTKRSPVPSVKRAVAPSEETGEPEVRRGYLANKAESYARDVPGYRLVTFILGKSPITGERVDRNATNLLGALLGMIPGGNRLFERLKESRVIEEAYTWVSGRLGSLKITWARIKGLIDALIAYLPALPSNAIAKAKSLFAPLVRDIVTFVGEVKDKILEFIIRGALKLAGPLAEKVWGVIKKAGAVISTILEDPLAFAKNLFKAVLQGFNQFGSNVLKHIKSGLLGWLFGTIQGLEITIPEKLDFKGLISIALQVVGLTYDNFRARLVKKLGPRGERMVSFLEKSVEVVKILVKEGFAGLWQRVLQMIEGFKETVIGGIRDFVIKTLIMGGLSWLAGLSNPVGAVVKVVLAIYNIIKTFLERLNQILEVANSIFSSIGAIAAGNVKQAADFIEKTIAATIPVVISFLAALVPVSGIVSSIRNIIKKLRKPVDKAIDKMIGFVVKKAKKLFSKIVAKLNKKRKLPKAHFRIGNTPHELLAVKKGARVEIRVASDNDQSADEARAKTEEEKRKARELEDVLAFVTAFHKGLGLAESEAEKMRFDSANELQNKKRAVLEDAMRQAGGEFTKYGIDLSQNPAVITDDKSDLLRFGTPVSELEGKAGTYSDLSSQKDTLKADDSSTTPRKLELDHNPSRNVLEVVQKWLMKRGNKSKKDDKRRPLFLKPSEANQGKSRKNRKSFDQVAKSNAFGILSAGASTKGSAVRYPALAIYGPYNNAMAEADKTDGTNMATLVNKTSASGIETVKSNLVDIMDDKLKAIDDYYKNDRMIEPSVQSVVRNNVAVGRREVRALALDKLNIDSASAESSDEQEREDTSSLIRKLSLTSRTKSDADAPNFLEAEGKVGTYNVMSDNYASSKYLEADHNPLDSDMLKTVSWKVADFLENDSEQETTEMMDTVKDKDNSKLVTNRIRRQFKEGLVFQSKSDMKPLLSFGGRRQYTQDRGGTVVISHDVNQHESMKQGNDKFKEDLLGPAGRAITDGIRKSTAEHLADPNRSDPLKHYRIAMNSAIRPIMHGRIEERQKRIFSLYTSIEAPEIHRINEAEGDGRGDRAVTHLAKISARMKSQGTTDALKEHLNRVFPINE